jgi:RND family efflux transporter MFP subunit
MMTKNMKNLSLAMAVVLIAALMVFALKALKPKVKKNRARASIPIVATVELSPSTYAIQIEANGTVIPARKIELLTEVEGMAVFVNPDMIPGGIIKEGEVILKIDSADYDLDIRNKRALVAEAKLNLELERAQQNIARKQWEDLNSTMSERMNMSLALRKPQLLNALAKLDAAESLLQASNLARARTTVSSPFNALVLEQNIAKGQLVSMQRAVATLVDIDEFWVQASVPLDKLRWINFPVDGNKPVTTAEVYLDLGEGNKAMRKARVYGLHGELDPKGRMAKVLLTLPDPFCLKGCEDSEGKSKLLLGSFVNIQIEAGNIKNAFSIARSAMRDNNTVWILSKDNKLEIREVKISWLRKDDILISNGLNAGEKLITSSLQSPLPGMELRAESTENVISNRGKNLR